VVVGRGPFATIVLGGVRVNFSLLPTRGVMVRGLCRFDVSGVSWRARAAIALAGPAATILEFLLGIALATDLWARSAPIARNILALSLLGLAISAIVNLLPRTAASRSAANVVANDGSQALAALRQRRARAPLPSPSHISNRDRSADPAQHRQIADQAAPPMALSLPHAPRPHGPSRLVGSPENSPLTERERDLTREATSVPPPRSEA